MYVFEIYSVYTSYIVECTCSIICVCILTLYLYRSTVNNQLFVYIHQQIVSCAGDGMIHFTDLDRESTYGQFQFDCHAGTTYEVHSV